MEARGCTGRKNTHVRKSLSARLYSLCGSGGEISPLPAGTAKTVPAHKAHCSAVFDGLQRKGHWDEMKLWQLGYRQELRRGFTYLNCVGLGISSIAAFPVLCE